MASESLPTSGTNQEAGKVFILYGTVKAVSPDGFTRQLTPNSPIFANDRIVTGPDGRISVVFADGHTQLDLGRMSDVLIDSDIYTPFEPDEAADIAAQVGDIQQALEDEGFDPSEQLDDPAAGSSGAGEGGGGHPYVVFEATGMEVTPDSGAETVGITTSFLAPSAVDIVEEVEPPPDLAADQAQAAVRPDRRDSQDEPRDLAPTAVGDQNEVTEGFQTITGSVYTNDTAGTRETTVTSVVIDGEWVEIPTSGSVTRLTDLGGELTLNSDGSYTYTILTSISHEVNGQGDGLDDFENFVYTITDGNGDTATATLTINILDTVPVANPDSNAVMEGSFTPDGDGQDFRGNQVEGNVTFGWDDGDLIAESADEQSADQGLHLVGVSGDFADGVVFAFGIELDTVQGGTILFSSDGSYVYTAPPGVSHPLDASGANLPVPEHFQYTVEDADGSSASAVLTINIEDSAPVAFRDTATVDEGDHTPGDGINNQISGNLILGEHADRTGDGSVSFGDVADLASADGGTHLVSVSGDFADGVVFALDTELGTAQGGTIRFSGDGAYTYTAPDSIDHSDALPDSELFVYTIADSDGSQASSSLTVNIADTAPAANDYLYFAPPRGDQGGDSVSYTDQVADGTGVNLHDAQKETEGETQVETSGDTEKYSGGSDDDLPVGNEGGGNLEGDTLIGGQGDDLGAGSFAGNADQPVHEASGIEVGLSDGQPGDLSETSGSPLAGGGSATDGDGEDQLTGERAADIPDDDGAVEGALPGSSGSAHETITGGADGDTFETEEVAGGEVADYEDNLDTLVPPVTS